ncbi:unnamed protein product [Acanthocheilonema viteae]|uniref:Chitin-binding type-2 domain-containing protein n=1 Tax=Acanthocheilonema viteae TaxID=6277 RepID=A0A498SI24_ACAVI|nr:unnamed protein product [Acanthocheilonema viteae]
MPSDFSCLGLNSGFQSDQVAQCKTEPLFMNEFFELSVVPTVTLLAKKPSGVAVRKSFGLSSLRFSAILDMPESDDHIVESLQLSSVYDQAMHHNMLVYSYERMFDGLYGEMCRNEMIVCFGEQAVMSAMVILLIRRPELLQYIPHILESSIMQKTREDSNILLNLESVKSANESKQQKQTTKEAFASEVKNQLSSKLKPLIFSCTSLSDSIYGDMNPTEFYLCIRGNTALLQCQRDFLYDAEAKYCKFQPKFIDVQEFTPHGAYAQGCTAECVVCISGLAIYTADCSLLLIDCSDKPNGPVSSGCSSNFQYCTDGKLEQYACPVNFKFDNAIQKCLPELSPIPMWLVVAEERCEDTH